MLVIEPNSLANINLLGHYDSLKHKPAQRTRHGMGHFRNYVYFSKHCTSSLKMLINPESTLIDPNRVFQFESRYFQYSLLQNKITFIHTRQEQKRKNNNNHNNRYFKNDYSKNVSGNNNNNNGKNNNNHKGDFTITEYLVFRFWHSTKDNSPIFGIAKRTDDGNCGGHIYQPWQCIDIVEHRQMLEYFGLSNANISSRNEFLSLLPTPVECYNKPFNNSISCEFNPNFHKIGGILRRGYQRYREGLMWDNFNDNDNNYRGNNSRMVRKNEPKFEYLDGIAMEMGISFDELIEKILSSITKAFKFARKNPEHVLTQAYIDEQNCQIFYESVLLAEITDYNTMKTYTLGVPVVDLLNEDNASLAPCYTAESILTPQMTIENIMLNTQAEDFNKMKQNSWISRMLDTKSFYYKCGFEKEIVDKEKEKAQAKAKAAKVHDSKSKVMNGKTNKTKGWQTDFPWNSTKYYYYK